jgi:hypothetical protein
MLAQIFHLENKTAVFLLQEKDLEKIWKTDQEA